MPVLTQIRVFRAPTITFSYWLFVFFLCSLAKPPTRNKPLFSLAILVWFRLSWTRQNCSFVGMFDSCCAQRSWDKKAFPRMRWRRFVCVLPPLQGRDWRFPLTSPIFPKLNEPNSYNIFSWVSWFLRPFFLYSLLSFELCLGVCFSLESQPPAWDTLAVILVVLVLRDCCACLT